MSIESLSVWVVSLLKRRSLNPDGRLLFAYDLSQDEYADLRSELSSAISEAGGIEVLANLSLGKKPLAAPPAAFVLYAAEWWKHDYGGGVWDWSPIIESLGEAPDSFENAQQLRSQFVTRGLAFWRLSPLDKGKRFIGSIVVNGGIPMRLLAQGNGPVAAVLSQVLTQASRYRWGHSQVLESVSDRLIQLPAAYRLPEIAQLLAQFVEAALQLKDEFQLEGVTDPIARLDAALPEWRRRFPVSLESEAAESLLTGLVRVVATQRAGAAHGLFLAERRLVQHPVTGKYDLESHIAYPSRIAAEDLAAMFGLADVEDVPRHFTIDLETETRQPYADGRLVYGAEEPVVVLAAKRIVVRNRAASSELQLILRSPDGDKGERYTLEGGSALPDEDPWIFVEGQGGYPVMAAAGGARLPHDSAWIALPPDWLVECDSEPDTIGELLCPGLAPRRILCLRSDARLGLSGIVYRVRLGQADQPGQIYQWNGQRLPEARGRSVFRARQPPKLFRSTDEGLRVVPLSAQQWRRLGTQEQLLPKEARGPVEVRILDEGELVARQRIFVLPPEARIEYVSGSVVGTGVVRFVSWGQIELAPEVASGVTTTISREGLTSVDIALSSAGAPPTEFRVRVRWPGTVAELSLLLPYPVTGGRFLHADGTVIQANETITLRELVGMRLQIFDTNPAHPKRYEVQLALGQGNRQVSSRYSIALNPGAGRAEVRLIDYQNQIEALLGLFDDLDAKVRVGLVVGGQLSSEIRVGRYSITLHSAEDCVQVPEDALGHIPVQELDTTRVFACPLTQPNAEPLELGSVRSEGVHTGSWATEGMSPELTPWLVYPAPDSSVMFRPMVWIAGPNLEGEDPNADSDQAIEVTNLPEAMSLAHQGRRWSSIHSVLKAMSEDHLHESWPLLDGMWNTFHHLPLTALDVWRMLSKQPKAVLSFLLRSELSEAELAEALRRLLRESGWMPELTTVADLCEVAQAFWRYWAEQGLEQSRIQKYFKDELEDRFKLLAHEIPSLGPIIETVVFAATGTMSDLLREVAGTSSVSTRELLRKLWDGGDSLVNAQLFLVNAEREISSWPGRDFIQQQAFPAFATACSLSNQQLLMPHFNKLFWPQQQDRKFSVVNLPVLCAVWAATSTSRKWWSDPGRRLALKQIRDFDPIWFEQAYRQAFKVCMSIDGLVQLPEITGR